jgi:hypothetical protein
MSINFSSSFSGFNFFKKIPISKIFTLPFGLGNSGKIADGSDQFTEEHIYEEGFLGHYKNNVKKHLDSFEDKRMSALLKVQKYLRIFWALLIPFIFLSYYIFKNYVEPSQNNNVFDIYLFANIAYFGLWLVLLYSPIKKFSGNVKDEVYKTILEFFDGFKYDASATKSNLHNLADDILPSYDRMYCEDNINGDIENVGFEFVELLLQDRRRNSKGGSSYVTVFDGVVIKLNMNKSFSGKTILAKDRGIFNKLSGKFKEGERVALEDPVFEKNFEVYSSDQIEARYLLSTSFMERLLSLRDLFKGKGLQGVFDNENFIMAIETNHNFFATPSIFEPVTFIPECKSILKEINLIREIIEILKLNQDIYAKNN